MEKKDKRSETNVEIWKKHQEKEAKGLKKTGSGAVVACYRWSEEMNIEFYFSVGLDSDEFGTWLENYYK